MFTKVQSIVSFIIPGREKPLSAQLSVDTDENTIQITCWSTTAAEELMKTIRSKELVIKIETEES